VTAGSTNTGVVCSRSKMKPTKTPFWCSSRGKRAAFGVALGMELYMAVSDGWRALGSRSIVTCRNQGSAFESGLGFVHQSGEPIRADVLAPSMAFSRISALPFASAARYMASTSMLSAVSGNAASTQSR
jgi:hypothetical protein